MIFDGGPKARSGKNGCPYCGAHKFVEGPSGGWSQNFSCHVCGARFNASPFGVEVTDEPMVKGCLYVIGREKIGLFDRLCRIMGR